MIVNFFDSQRVANLGRGWIWGLQLICGKIVNGVILYVGNFVWFY